MLLRSRLALFSVVGALLSVCIGGCALLGSPPPLEPTIGLQFSGLYANQTYTPSSNSDNQKSEFYGGLGFRYSAPICSRSMLWGEAWYTMRGSGTSQSSGISSYTSKETFNFLSLDFLADYTLAECRSGRLYGMAGPGFNFFMSGTSQYTSTFNGMTQSAQADIKSDDVRKMSIDGIVGIGGNFHLTKSWALYGDLRYDLGLSTITNSTSPVQVKNNAIQIGIGIEHIF